MWLLAGVGAALAVLGSDAAPTGLAAVDALYRAGLVALLVVAGARARRWSLLLGAGITAACAVGPPRAGALVALVIILVMVVADRRSRVADAAVGGLVGLGALSLQVGGPLGVETLLAAVATVPILYGAYRYTSKRAQRRWRRGLLAVSIAAVVATVLAALGVGLAVGDVQAGVDATRDGVELAGDGDGPGAAAAFAEAEGAFVAANSSVGAGWVSPARLVPIVGPNVEVLQRSVAIGADLNGAASNVAEQVDFASVQRVDGGVDLAALTGFEVPVELAADAADDAVEVLDGLDSPWTVAPLADRLELLADEVDQVQSQTELAALGVRDGPAMLGAEGPRRYLVLLGNPAELRDMGGHVGNWAEVVATDGKLELVEVGGPLELSTPLDQAPQWVRDELPLSLSVLKPTEFPQNWGGDPDTSVMARLAGDLFEQRTGRPVDGVLYADTEAFAAFVQLTGPVEVPGLPEPYQLTAANAEQFLTRDQFTLFEREVDANAAVEAVIDEVFSRLTNTELPSPQALGALFSPVVRGGHMSMGTRRDDDVALVERLGLDGTVEQPVGGDVLAVLQRNAGPNKIDSFLSRTIDVDLQWNPATGDVRSLVTVELRNDAPAEGYGPLVLGNRQGQPDGSNVADLSVVTPFMLQAARVDGNVVAAQPLLQEDLWRHTVRVVVPPGSSRFVTFEMFGQVAPGDRYDLAFVGQPIMGENTLDVDLLPSGGPARLTQVSGDSSSDATSGVDAGSDSVFSWRSGNQN